MSVISEKLAGMLNEQIGRELANRSQYLMFANWFSNQGLKRLSDFFKGEAEGELGHSDKFIAYLNEANCPLVIPLVEKKVSEFKDIMDISDTYTLAEEETTGYLKEIWDETIKEDDAGTGDFIQPLMREQIEEESTTEKFASRCELCNGNLLLLDLMFDK